MKRLSILLLSFTIFMVSCYPVKIAAPYGQKTTLATKSENLPFREKQKNWYILWGLVPISHNGPDRIIGENGLKKVRVETKMNFGDFLIAGILGGVSVVTTTTIIEGSSE